MAPDLEKPGMVTDAHWIDLDQDQDLDLMVVGEWMPISLYLNENGQFRNITTEKGLENTTGWWNRIAAADMDGDGDEDFIIGNLGLNIKFKASEQKPFTVKVKDFDGNGTNDVYLAYYDKNGTLYPVRGRECSAQQMPFVKEKFKTYDAFAKASFGEVLSGLEEGALSHQVKIFESIYLENTGSGQFKVKPLPKIAQAAPVYGILPRDWNGDGFMDILLAGNYYEREIETTRSDAGIGTLLLGNGKGDFSPLSPNETGIFAYQDVRAIALLENQNKQPLVFILNNNTTIQVYGR